MQQRLRVDGDIFYTDKKRCVFKNIRISLDEASISTIFLHSLFIGESTPLSINTLLEPRQSSLEKNLLSDLSRVKTGRFGDLLSLKTHRGKQLRRCVMS